MFKSCNVSETCIYKNIFCYCKSKPDSFWNVLLNPFRVPDNVHPIIWEGILIKNRIFLLSASLVWMMVGLLYLQKREKFV